MDMRVERISFTRSVVFWGLAGVSNFHTMRFEIYFFLWIRGVVAEADVLASYR